MNSEAAFIPEHKASIEEVLNRVRREYYFGTKHDGRIIAIDCQRIDKSEMNISPHDTVIEVRPNGKPVSDAIHIIDPNAPVSMSSPGSDWQNVSPWPAIFLSAAAAFLNGTILIWLIMHHGF